MMFNKDVLPANELFSEFFTKKNEAAFAYWGDVVADNMQNSSKKKWS
jgi:hypothetical protein